MANTWQHIPILAEEIASLLLQNKSNLVVLFLREHRIEEIDKPKAPPNRQNRNYAVEFFLSTFDEHSAALVLGFEHVAPILKIFDRLLKFFFIIARSYAFSHFSRHAIVLLCSSF